MGVGLGLNGIPKLECVLNRGIVGNKQDVGIESINRKEGVAAASSDKLNKFDIGILLAKLRKDSAVILFVTTDSGHTNGETL